MDICVLWAFIFGVRTSRCVFISLDPGILSTPLAFLFRIFEFLYGIQRAYTSLALVVRFERASLGGKGGPGSCMPDPAILYCYLIRTCCIRGQRRSYIPDLEVQ